MIMPIENSTGYIESAELVAFIKSIIGWKEFDIQNLSGTDEICVQVVSGIEKAIMLQLSPERMLNI